MSENTTDAAPIVPELIAPSSARALSTVVSRKPGNASLSCVRRSIHVTNCDSPIAATIHTTGTANRLDRADSM